MGATLPHSGLCWRLQAAWGQGREDRLSAGFVSRKLILAAVSLEAGPDSRQGSVSYQLCAGGQIISPSEPQCFHLSNADSSWEEQGKYLCKAPGTELAQREGGKL